jgi:hypothetical protein
MATSFSKPVLLHMNDGSVQVNGVSGKMSLVSNAGTVEATQSSLAGSSMFKTNAGTVTFTGNIGTNGTYDFEGNAPEGGSKGLTQGDFWYGAPGNGLVRVGAGAGLGWEGALAPPWMPSAQLAPRRGAFPRAAINAAPTIHESAWQAALSYSKV